MKCKYIRHALLQAAMLPWPYIRRQMSQGIREKNMRPDQNSNPGPLAYIVSALLYLDCLYIISQIVNWS